MHVSAPVYIAALFLLTFCLQSLSSLVRNPRCLAQEVLAVGEKRQGSFHGRMTVLVPLMAGFQGSSALGPELKGVWHGPGVLSRYPRWKGASVQLTQQWVQAGLYPSAGGLSRFHVFSCWLKVRNHYKNVRKKVETFSGIYFQSFWSFIL